MVHRERQALIADLAELPAQAWETPSLCPGWSVHDVAAHLVDNARTTTPRLVLAMIRARGDFDRQNDAGVTRERGATPAVTVQRLREVAGRTSGPPVSTDSRLVEEVVHGEDIRRPLGIARRYPGDAVKPALRYQVRTSVAMGGGRDRVQGLALVATDRELRLGDGPEVVGPVLALLLAVSGRTAFLDKLTGPGMEVLRDRLAG